MRLLSLVLLAACGTASPEGPRAIRTPEHLEEARKHDEIARSRTSWPVAEEVTPPARPFAFTWDPDADHTRVREQQGEAAAVQQAFKDACHQREVEKTGSPLTRHRVGGWNTEDGVVVLLGVVAGPRETLLADLRCHRAWLMAGPGVDKDAPLALPGLLVDAKGTQDGIMLTLTLKDAALIPELQRRVVRQIEASRRLAGHEP